MLTSRTFNKLVDAWSASPRYIDSEGGTRSGKTYSILQLFILVVKFDKTATINSVVSETVPHLKRGAIRDFKRIMMDEGIWDESRWREADKIYTFENEAILEFFSADAPGKVHGPARDRLFINEAQNIPYEVARQLFIRTRGLIAFDYNPTHVFWAHEKIKGRDNCISIHSTYRDNQYLTPEQIEEIESNKGDKNWWRVYGEGKVGQLDGIIYDFEQIDALPEKSDGMIETYGLDFGFTNDPTACVHCLIDTRKKALYLDQVIFRRGLLNQEIARLFEANNVPKRSIPIYADAAEPKSIAELAQYGYNIKPCYKATKITEQIAHICQYRMYVTKQSVDIIRELRGYVWAKDKDENKLNEPIKINDHAMDALRYGVFTPLSDFRRKEIITYVSKHCDMITAYNQMPITTYGKILSVIADPCKDSIDKEVAMISILTAKTTDEVENMPLVELRGLTSQLGFLTEKAEAVEVRKEYKVGDLTLIPEKKITKIKAGQFISFQEFAKVYRDNNADVKYIPYLLSCFMIPKGKKFAEGYNVEDVQEAIAEHLSIVDALSLTAFFLTKIKQSQANILHYLEWRLRLTRAKTEEQKIAKKMQIATLRAMRRSVLNGVGR